MAKKTAQVDIKLTGLKTVEELEQYLNDINAELNNIDKNSAKFQTLTTNANAATAKLKTMDTNLKSFTAQEKTDAIKKLGEGLVGAFQIGAGASLIFGEKTGEQMTKLIGKVAGVYAAVDGLDKVSKAFSTENIARLKALGAQFGFVGKASKIAGAEMKAAMIASGIGLAIIALGILISQYDKWANKIKETRKEKELLENKNKLEQQVKTAQELNKLQEETANKQKEINKLRGEEEKNAAIDLELYKKKIELINQEQDLLKANQAIFDNNVKKAQEKVDKEKAFVDLLNTGTNKRMEKKAQEELKVREAAYQVAKDELDIAKQQQITNTENLALLAEQARVMQNDINMKPMMDSLNNQIFLLEDANKALDAEGYKVTEIYNNNQKIVKLKKEQNEYMRLQGKITEEVYQKTKISLSTEAGVLADNNKKRLDALTLELKILTNAHHYEQAIKAVNDAYQNINTVLSEHQNKLSQNDVLLGNYSDMMDLIKEGYKEYNAMVDDGLHFDIQRQKIMQLTTEQLIPSSISLSKEALSQFKALMQQAQKFSSEAGVAIDSNLTSVDNFNKKIKDSYESSKQSIVMQSNGMRLNEKKLEQAANQLSIEKASADVMTGILETQKSWLVDSKNALQTDNDRLQKLINIEDAMKAANLLEINSLSAKRDATKSEEKKVEYAKQIDALLTKSEQANVNISGYQNDIYVNNVKTKEVKLQIAGIDSQEAQITAEIATTQQTVTAELVKQSTISEQMKKFASDYAEEIQGVQDVMNAIFAFSQAKLAEQAKDADKRIAAATKKLETLNKKQEKSNERLKDLQNELKDADGERYNELLNLIKAEQDAQTENGVSLRQQIAETDKAQKQAEFDKATAEYESAKQARLQNIINAVINGALAVVKALPNIPLAIIAGVLSAAAIATMIATKLPAKPAKGDFGLAKGGLLQGKLHKDGGIPVGDTGIEVEGNEFVVNRKATQQYLPVLEAINNTGRQKYADGGQLPNVSTQQQQEFINYEKLAAAILAGIQPTVSVTEINRMQQKVKVIQTAASL
jgi:hypothetical protein